MIGAGAAAPDSLVVDAHVHGHPCFDTGTLLDTAADRLGAVPVPAPLAAGARLGYLLLAETPGETLFDQAMAGLPGVPGWTARPTGEAESLLAVDERGRRLALVAGRQIPTRERLEVLAVGTRATPTVSLSLDDTVSWARENAALVIVPWGFGKWWGGRGRRVDATAARLAASDWFFLGDSGGRPRGGPSPAIIARAAARGIRVLPGSDPLPFPEEARRVGTAGSIVPGRVDPGAPLRSLVQGLRNGAEPVIFRSGIPLFPFVRNQLRMQLIAGSSR